MPPDTAPAGALAPDAPLTPGASDTVGPRAADDC